MGHLVVPRLVRVHGTGAKNAFGSTLGSHLFRRILAQRHMSALNVANRSANRILAHHEDVGGRATASSVAAERHRVLLGGILGGLDDETRLFV